VTELQKDPITRGDFLGFGALGAIMGAILTIPPVAFVLSPLIKTDFLGQSNVDEGWQEVGPVSEVPVDEPKVFEVDFPITQSYGDRQIQEESGVTDKQFTVTNAVWLSWKAPVLSPGRQGSAGDELGKPKKPEILNQKSEGFTAQEREEIKNSLNVLSNSCAHLGCPVRWVFIEGKGEFLCPCHGGIYDINGGWVGGPPPRGMYSYAEVEVRENGRLYIKHGYEIEPGIPGISTQEPYVV
jgi:Rieske Fe-S protein